MITKNECKERIKEILEKNKYTLKEETLFELYLNIYFILDKKRKIAQVWTNRHRKLIKSILKKDYPYFICEDETQFVLYDPKSYDITKINKTWTKKYAQDLGKFYVCAGNLEDIYKKHKKLLRPVITVFYYNTTTKSILECEILAQMCPIQTCLKNLDLFFDIRKEYQKYVNKINPYINIDFRIYTYHRSS